MAKRKPGKYDAVLDGLTPMPLEDDPRRQAKIDALKAEGYGSLSATDLTAEYATIRRRRDALKTEEAELQLKLDALIQLLVASEEAGMDAAWGAYGANDNSVRLLNGDAIRVNKEPASKVVDAEAFRLWCIANGYERKLQLHAGTRESIVAERLLAGVAEPDGVEVGSWSKVTFTKGSEQ